MRAALSSFESAVRTCRTRGRSPHETRFEQCLGRNEEDYLHSPDRTAPLEVRLLISAYRS